MGETRVQLKDGKTIAYTDNYVPILEEKIILCRKDFDTMVEWAKIGEKEKYGNTSETDNIVSRAVKSFVL